MAKVVPITSESEALIPVAPPPAKTEKQGSKYCVVMLLLLTLVAYIQQISATLRLLYTSAKD
jgi:hypothetical protein